MVVRIAVCRLKPFRQVALQTIAVCSLGLQWHTLCTSQAMPLPNESSEATGSQPDGLAQVECLSHVDYSALASKPTAMLPGAIVPTAVWIMIMDIARLQSGCLLCSSAGQALALQHRNFLLKPSRPSVSCAPFAAELCPKYVSCTPATDQQVARSKVQRECLEDVICKNLNAQHMRPLSSHIALFLSCAARVRRRSGALGRVMRSAEYKAKET